MWNLGGLDWGHERRRGTIREKEGQQRGGRRRGQERVMGVNMIKIHCMLL
jgi:hypothetical protein